MARNLRLHDCSLPLETKMKRQYGFTLIELMIVVAVIAILAAIALPTYQDYVAKSQATAALADIRGGKTGLEMSVADEKQTLVNAAYLGLADTERCRDVTAFVSGTGIGTISCTLIGNSLVNSSVITLTRSISGVWTCTAGIMADKYKPFGCS